MPAAAGRGGSRGDRDRLGYRNGHGELTVKTTAGPVTLERPTLRGPSEPFVSRLLSKGVSRTNALEALVISRFVRGLSTRDVEATLVEKVKQGGSGVWGQVPMTPNPHVPDEDLHAVVKWILALK